MREFVSVVCLFLLLITPGLAQDEPSPSASPNPNVKPQPTPAVLEFEPAPSASPAPLTETREVWRIGVAGSEPFVVREGQSLQGLSVEVWEALVEIFKFVGR